jgi:hypothetical protein
VSVLPEEQNCVRQKSAQRLQSGESKASHNSLCVSAARGAELRAIEHGASDSERAALTARAR